MIKLKKINIIFLFCLIGFPKYVSATLSSEKLLRIKTYREISLALETRTSVNQYTDNIRKYFLSRYTTMPQTGNITELTSEAIASTLGLSSLFCEKMIMNDSKIVNQNQRWAHSMIDFSQLPSRVFTQVVRKDLYETYAELFWERKLLEAEIIEFDLIINGLIYNTNYNLIEILSVTCAVFGASFESFLNH